MFSDFQILLIAGGAALVCFIILIITFCISIGNARKLKRLMSYSEKGNLIEALEKYYDKLNNTAEEIRVSSAKIDKAENDCRNSLSRVGIVNFNAYDYMIGNYSFSLALMNQHNDGFVLTSLYGNDSCCTYIKSLNRGKSSSKLTKEEEDAVSQALYVEGQTTD